MIKIKPHQKESLLKNIRKPTVKEEYDKSHFVISFKHLDRNQGQTFKEWEAEKILARAVNTLSGYRNLSMKMRHLRQKFSVPPDRFLEAPAC
jgi:hypothetical protein